ncbi:hypothetical protein [Pedobacter mucosus]|uniref:hypothetical protein n=1 Tax=Pedobacter mucosus TaxID=2895286 RepID=UPI001EE3D145|nr:hypothetical protein [Pedobacter mucosus]UKT65461.1 hypothetical protein LOK61_06655 [Pedobacter mucosus]
MNGRTYGRIFSKGRISEIFEKAFDSIKSLIEGETENYILNANENEYADHIESKYKLQIPEIHFDQVSADSYETDIPAEYFPQSFNVFEGKKYKKEVIQYFIPCSGDINLLAYGPANTFSIGGGGDFEIKGDAIVAEFINFSNNAEEINRNYQSELNGIHSNYNYLRIELGNFNSNLKNYILSVFDQRKEKLLNKNSLLSSLGVPLRKKANAPETFSVPKPLLREQILVKPVVHDKGFAPEPTLDNDNYKKILKIINDVGKNFERMPSVYKNKGEEDLRDHILMVLDPNFENGSASGETFNKTGKTDIQLRYNSSVVFIAECKFWSGSKGYLATIDQLLRYLTWRDNKASIVIFVREKDFSSILDKIESTTSTHPNYLTFLNKSDENWFNFRFHLNGDRNREVHLAIQLYNIPPID